ncbi:DUF2502 domain-containing protein [Burkholderia sp. S-53]|uniref:DUF2502 domain-containing protein n=1 Tax=Burkholderia sp. S-53 TaxID=2906514 RepID=UPI0021D0B273|nr:DUF2502 domain-containing protein [Burkholderia sp. S-53]UXU86039.1 DUF2502 domain-containing protein [Burkholderia sp. S-53]
MSCRPALPVAYAPTAPAVVAAPVMVPTVGIPLGRHGGRYRDGRRWRKRQEWVAHHRRQAGKNTRPHAALPSICKPDPAVAAKAGFTGKVSERSSTNSGIIAAPTLVRSHVLRGRC